jgi:hypothetical protein
MKQIPYTILVPLVIVVSFIGIFFWKYQEPIIEYFKDDYFTDKKVLALCNAGHDGDIKEIDKLLAEGANINHRGKDGVTPLYWVLISKRKTKKTKEGFKYFLEKGADPTMVVGKYGRTLLGYAAMYKDTDYLKMALESGIENVDLEKEDTTRETPLLSANLAGRFESFKLLLDYGADIEWRRPSGESPLIEVSSSDGWKYSWELLQRGADYTVDTGGHEGSDFIFAIENLTYRPSVRAKKGFVTDYRKLCVEFLREKGVEVNPWMPENEKYIKRDGKWILQVTSEDGEIKEYTLEDKKERK